MVPKKEVVVVVGGPGDETLWLGGTMLLNPHWNVRVLALSGGEDPAVRARFFRAMEVYDADCWIEDFSLEGESCSVSSIYLGKILLDHLKGLEMDLLYTHSVFGEFTGNSFREKAGETICSLWNAGYICAKQLRIFAYTDFQGTDFPRACPRSHLKTPIPESTFAEKRRILREIYGYQPESWEARTNPMTEACWAFREEEELRRWQERKGAPRSSVPPASDEPSALNKVV